MTQSECQRKEFVKIILYFCTKTSTVNISSVWIRLLSLDSTLFWIDMLLSRSFGRGWAKAIRMRGFFFCVHNISTSRKSLRHADYSWVCLLTEWFHDFLACFHESHASLDLEDETVGLRTNELSINFCQSSFYLRLRWRERFDHVLMSRILDGFLLLREEMAKRGLDEMEPLSNISSRIETVSLSLSPCRYNQVYRKRKGTNIEINVQFNGA